MKNKFKIIFSVIGLCMIGLTGCKPSYESPLDKPMYETKAPDEPYDIDFIQVHNETIEKLQWGELPKVFPFIKNLEIDGDNKSKTADLMIEVQTGVNSESIEALVTTVAKFMADDAADQDFRLEKSSEVSMGSFYDQYTLQIKVMQDGDLLYDEIVPAGEGFPFDVEVDGNAIINATKLMKESENA